MAYRGSAIGGGSYQKVGGQAKSFYITSPQGRSHDLLMGWGIKNNGERVSASLKRESEGGALSGVQGQSPWSGVRGASPP